MQGLERGKTRSFVRASAPNRHGEGTRKHSLISSKRIHFEFGCVQAHTDKLLHPVDHYSRLWRRARGFYPQLSAAKLQPKGSKPTNRRILNTNYANKRQLSERKIKPQNESRRKRSEQRRAGSSVSSLRFKALFGSVFQGLEFWAPFRKSVSVFLCRSKLAFIGVIGVQNPPVRTFFPPMILCEDRSPAP
jgi:hypothetical protein